MAYLCQLGPAALPALNLLAQVKATSNANGEGWERLLQNSAVSNCRPSLVARHTDRMADWRAWTFRGHRLTRYIQDTDARVAGAHQVD
jgi:hypothetical protein